MATKSISIADLEELSHDELAERFKESDLELCIEPLSEWGSTLEELFQKLEKGVMGWYETGIKRSFVVCFLDEAKESVVEVAQQETTSGSVKEAQASEPLAAPVVLHN
jgi:hypothetical protein